MTGTVILIMILGGSSNQSGYTTIQQTFGTMEACNNARQHIVNSIKTREYSAITIHSQGCYIKG